MQLNDKNIATNRDVYVVLSDITKAFDTVSVQKH